MPTIIVYGMPKFDDADERKSLIDQLINSVVNTVDMGMRKEQTFVFFPDDQVESNLGRGLVCFVECIPAHGGLMKEGRAAIAGAVYSTLSLFVRRNLAQCVSVTVRVSQINRECDELFSGRPYQN